VGGGPPAGRRGARGERPAEAPADGAASAASATN
jgi:hypothetical protein